MHILQPIISECVYDLDRYLNIRRAYGASLSHHGLAFLTDVTGVPQVWALDEPVSWPNQRTFFQERVTFVTWSPVRPELVFGMDQAGNERQQLFRLDAEGTTTSLTDHPDAKHLWGGWAHSGEQFAFTSNRRDPSVFDIYTQDRHGSSEAIRHHEGSGRLSIAGWSPADDRLLVHEAHSNVDHDIHILDLENGELDRCSPQEAEDRFARPTWGPDGESVYVLSDRGRDTLALARLDPSTRTVDTVVDGGEWNVDGLELDTETGRLVYSRNVEGYTELVAGELSGETEVRTISTPDLPDGVVGGVSFDEDAERFALTVSAPTLNPNVYVVDVDSGRHTRWTAASTAGIPRETFVDSELIRYQTFDDRAIPAFFSLPAESSDEPVPVIVDIHGGPEVQRRPTFGSLKQYFLAHGYAVFEPNVRGSAGYGTAYTRLDDVDRRLDAVKDIEAAGAWLQTRDRIDPDKLVAMGASYGGFMVLAALTEAPDLWAAGVDVVGIANLVTFLENTGAWRTSHREAEYGSLERDRALLESISPVSNIESIEAPLFVLHGANDPRVPVGEAEQIAAAARDQGVPVELMIFEDEGHGITKRENRLEAYAAVVEFLDTHLQGSD